MSIVNTIVTKASTEPSFYKLLATDFDKAIAPYRLTKIQLSDLKTKLNNVKNEVISIKPSRYNYYRLIELKNGLN